MEPDDKKEKSRSKMLAGSHEAKEELQEIVEFLRTRKNFGHRRQNSQGFADGSAEEAARL